MRRFSTERIRGVVRQEDAISSKVFTASPKDAFKILYWKVARIVGRCGDLSGAMFSCVRFSDELNHHLQMRILSVYLK